MIENVLGAEDGIRQNPSPHRASVWVRERDHKHTAFMTGGDKGDEGK